MRTTVGSIKKSDIKTRITCGFSPVTRVKLSEKKYMEIIIDTHISYAKRMEILLENLVLKE